MDYDKLIESAKARRNRYADLACEYRILAIRNAAKPDGIKYRHKALRVQRAAEIAQSHIIGRVHARGAARRAQISED